MRFLLIKLSIFLLLMNLFSFGANAQSEHIRIKAQTTNSTPKAGEEFEIQLSFEMDDYWYTYSLFEQVSEDGYGPGTTEISLKPTQNLKIVGEIKTEKPKRKYDKGFEMEIDYFNGKFQYVVSAIAQKDLDFSRDSAFAEVYVMICDTVQCLPPTEYLIQIDPNEIESAETSFTPFEYPHKNESENKEIKKVQTNSNREIEEAKEGGILGFFIFAMLQGLLALTTPCVFPMIPITVSFFTKRSEKANVNGLVDSVLYAIGIILTFTGIGLIVSMIAGPTGVSEMATNPWVNMAVAGVFILFAFNLFGAFEIQIPTKFLNMMNAKSQGGGKMGIILMGFTFSLTSFTCTVPFVGSTLMASSTGGDMLYPVIGMLGFSSVFALPFFLLALFPSLMKNLPKSGGWMNNIKVVMGFIEIAAAVKFISNVDLAWGLEIITRDLFISVWLACGLLVVIYILGFFHFKLDSKVERVGAMRTVWALAFATISIYLFTGLMGKPLGTLDAFMPPGDYGVNISESGFSSGSNKNAYKEQKWYKNYDEALAVAKSENKKLFIDFTGWQCTNCRWMEKNMFPKSEISSLMSGMIKVKLYTDRRQEPEISNKKMQLERFNSIALPLYVILMPDEQIISTMEYTNSQDEFIAFLKTGS
jgi:thiol:disulfide interchange protein